MQFYPKIDNLFPRLDNGQLEDLEFKRASFECISVWHVTEKIDGSCHYITFYADGSFDFGGKTPNSQIPTDVIQLLQQLGEKSGSDIAAMIAEHGVDIVTFYGEAYGPKIQKGGKYRDDVDFIVFDVNANGKWLDQEQVTSACETAGFNRVPVIEEIKTTQEVVHFVGAGFQSRVGKPGTQGEGVVMRTPEPLYDRKGHRVMAKLKTEDVQCGSFHCYA